MWCMMNGEAFSFFFSLGSTINRGSIINRMTKEKDEALWYQYNRGLRLFVLGVFLLV